MTFVEGRNFAGRGDFVTVYCIMLRNIVDESYISFNVTS